MIAYDRLSLIIPPDQALANKALQASLQQITGISGSILSEFATAVANLTSARGLALVQAQTQALPTSTYNYYLTNFGGSSGTGVNNQITIADVLGAAAGLPYTKTYASIVENIASLNSLGQLTTLISIYNTMLNVVDGVYGLGPIVIPSGPAAGTYSDYDTAFAGNTPPTPGTGLIPAAQSAINTIVLNNSSITTTLNVNSTAAASGIIRETSNQSKAGIVWADLIANDRSSLMGFISNLSNYGQNLTEGGPSQMLENMADTTVLGGQALVASLREAKNVQVLSDAGISTSTQVSADSNPPQPDISVNNAQYSESQAQQQLIF